MLQNKWNVIFVDWFGGADLPITKYPLSASNMRLVASVTAQWLLTMQDEYFYPTRLIHCVGVSLGAHTCGFIGKHLLTRGFSLQRITGNGRTDVKKTQQEH